MNDINEQILAMSHAHFNFVQATPETIREFIDRMSNAYQDHDIDEDWLFRKLESIHYVTIGDAFTLDDDFGHEEWFNPSTNLPFEDEIKWHYWDHYQAYLLTQKGWPPKVIKSIDNLSSQILSRVENPRRDGPWDRRGMVMGSVQSGKTANYTGLITKAADAGYKLIIVMAGVHNSLRSQTQSRLNEEFVGYDLDKIDLPDGNEKPIGVRNMFPDHRAPNTATNSNENGDFNRKVISHVGMVPNPEGQPILLVIKKNVSILKNLYGWLTSIIPQRTQKGEFIIKDIPLLLIDDECDYASINTKLKERDENGNIVDEWNPTAINKSIRKILKLFEKSVYIGYTATPYANIFIRMDDRHSRYGEDLFPRSFIISLPPPSNYIGPDRLFGLNYDPLKGTNGVDPLPLIRDVWDNSEFIPDVHKKDLFVPGLPPSMKHAIKSFLLTCAARSIRKEGIPHNSMLIHVTRYTAVQTQINDLVVEELRNANARMLAGDSLDDFREIWERDFLPTTSEMGNIGFNDAIAHDWKSIRKVLFGTTKVIRVKLINGTAKDVLDYRDHELAANRKNRKGDIVTWENKGLSVIAIGGDKLSRGLTLEGLSISYYLRFTYMYDTLMQMGRWFGYKEGFTDLCRIYTTEELSSWYRYIAGATKELREEIEYMSDLGETPETFGLKIKSHPGRLVVTSANKSRDKEKILLSYSGRISETVVFNPNHSANNLKALENLVMGIGRECDYEVIESKPRFRWSDIESDIILNFLHTYKTQEEAKRVVDPDVMGRYIEQQNKNHELMKWDVVLVSNQEAQRKIRIANFEIGCVKRKPLKLMNEKISIRRLVSPTDEMLDLTEGEIMSARRYDRNVLHRDTGINDKPSNEAIRYSRPKERGLLLIYIPYNDNEPSDSYGNNIPVVGFAISFPESDTAVPIEYWVNPIYLDEDKRFT